VFGAGSQAFLASAHHILGMRPPRITDEKYARIPALLEQGMRRTEIAAMYGVTPGTLAVFCSQRGISLRKGGRRKRKLVLSDEPLPLSNYVLKSLHEAARSLGKGSTDRLVSDLLEKIVSDDLYKAVLDEEATPDRPVTDPTSPPPCERVDPTEFVHSPPLAVNSIIIATATTISCLSSSSSERATPRTAHSLPGR
jgi:Helix-turn-helix domain of resolvase